MVSMVQTVTYVFPYFLPRWSATFLSAPPSTSSSCISSQVSLHRWQLIRRLLTNTQRHLIHQAPIYLTATQPQNHIHHPRILAMKKFERLRHIRYFTHSLQNLPSQYSSADTNRLTLVHFCIQSLDVLGALPDHHGRCCGDVETEVYLDREEIVEWIYALQTLPLVTVVGGGEERCAHFLQLHAHPRGDLFLGHSERRTPGVDHGSG